MLTSRALKHDIMLLRPANKQYRSKPRIVEPGIFGICCKLLRGKREEVVAGKDLNLRPLGYEAVRGNFLTP